jgi:S1-C subfamily serine protease
MADQFLTKSQISPETCLEVGEGLALERYPALHALLEAHLGAEGASLFAEPLISRGNDKAAPSVSWYTDLEGDGVPATRLDDAGRAALAAALSRALRDIRPLIDDPDDGPLLAAALHVLGPGDIWSVRGRPVIINWGMLPAETGRDLQSRTAHYEATLGRYLPLGAAPPLTEAERRARTGRRSPAATSLPPEPPAVVPARPVEPPPPIPPVSMAPNTPPPPPPRSRLPRVAWLPLVLLLALAAGALAWLLVPGNRLFPDTSPPAIATASAIELAEEVNRALEDRVASLNEALDGAMCHADGTLLLPDGQTIEGLAPPNPEDPADGPGAVTRAGIAPLLPPDPARVVAPAAPDGSERSLLDLLETRTALVIATGPEGAMSGTGFFVAPDMLVTNHHVVAEAAPDRVFVTNEALGQVYPAEIIKTLGPMETTGADFALLRVRGISQPAFEIYDGAESLKLRAVIAAGYPGDLLGSDAEFQALVAGDGEAVPELVVTDGIVNAERRIADQTDVVVHSAPISTGNSGGPLVDMCGRIVGVNTFVQQGPLRNLSFALSTADLIAFLRDTGVVAQTVSEPCAPEVRRPAPPPPAEADPAAAGAPAPAR